MEISSRGPQISAPTSRPSLAEPGSVPLGDRVSSSAGDGTKLSLVEHNGVQIELMKRMGAGREPAQMMEWISSHAGRFRELIEGEQAGGWRSQLRDPEQRGAALAALQQQLLMPQE